MRAWQLEALKEQRNKLFFKLWALSGDCKRRKQKLYLNKFLFNEDFNGI